MFGRFTKKLEPTPIGKLVVLMVLVLFLGAATVLVVDTLETRDSGTQTTWWHWWYGFSGVVMFTFVTFVASVITANSLAKDIRSWDRFHGNRAAEPGPGVSAIGEGSEIGKLVVLMLLFLFLGAATVLVVGDLETRDSGTQTTWWHWWYGFSGVVMFTFATFVGSVITANSLAKDIRALDRSHGNRAAEPGPSVSVIGEASDEPARESASG